MRMRKKKHLEERLENISELLFISDLEDRNFNNAASNPEYIDFDKLFGRTAPHILEIGCGKGGFAVEFAKGCGGHSRIKQPRSYQGKFRFVWV